MGNWVFSSTLITFQNHTSPWACPETRVTAMTHVGSGQRVPPGSHFSNPSQVLLTITTLNSAGSISCGCAPNPSSVA